MTSRPALVLTTCFALMIVSVPSAHAEGYRCSFVEGGAHVLERGTYRSRPAGELAFDIEKVDRAAQTAELVTPRGRGTLKLVLAFGATHFIEVATEGFLNLTTIYDTEVTPGQRAAVHSRHSGIGGEPVVSQMLGQCGIEKSRR